MHSLTKYQILFTCLALICMPIMLLFDLNDKYLNVLKDFVLTILFCFAIVYNLVKSYEKKHLVNTLNGLDVIINNFKLKYEN